MSQTFKKRGRELEAAPASTDVREEKRCHCEETDRFCHLLELDKTLLKEEEKCVPSEVINEVMKSLEEEIDMTFFTSYPSSNSGDNSLSSEISSGHEGETLASGRGVDLSYLLQASDDQLGIPLSPVLDFNDEVWQSPKERSDVLLGNPDHKSLGEIWHFEDDIENYGQFASYEDACEASQVQDYMNRGFVSEDISFDGEFSVGWTLETVGCL